MKACPYCGCTRLLVLVRPGDWVQCDQCAHVIQYNDLEDASGLEG